MSKGGRINTIHDNSNQLEFDFIDHDSSGSVMSTRNSECQRQNSTNLLDLATLPLNELTEMSLKDIEAELSKIIKLVSDKLSDIERKKSNIRRLMSRIVDENGNIIKSSNAGHTNKKRQQDPIKELIDCIDYGIKLCGYLMKVYSRLNKKVDFRTNDMELGIPQRIGILFYLKEVLGLNKNSHINTSIGNNIKPMEISNSGGIEKDIDVDFIDHDITILEGYFEEVKKYNSYFTNKKKDIKNKLYNNSHPVSFFDF